MKRLLEVLLKFGKRLRGFTLLEILLVVTIITIIVAMAIPTLSKSKGGAYEAGATKALKTLGEAEMAYSNVYGHYTSFDGLRVLGFVNRDLRKYNAGGDTSRMAKHYSISYRVRNTYRYFTFGYEYVAFPDSNLDLDTFFIREDGTVEVIRGTAAVPR